MKIFNAFSLSTLLFILITTVHAQNESWTLDKCILRAWDSNLTLLMDRNNTNRSLYNKRQTLLNLFPNINSNHHVNFDNGRSLDEDNRYTLDPIYSASHSVSSSVILFRGFSNLNFYKASRYAHLSTSSYEMFVKQQLALQVMNTWYTYLLQQGIVLTAEERVKTATKQLDYTLTMVETGRLEPAAQLDAESTLSFARLELQKEMNTANKTGLDLQQMLELDYDASFTIDAESDRMVMPSKNHFSADSIYHLATLNFQKIKELEYDLASVRYSLKAQRGRLAPTLSANAGLSSSYFKKTSDTGAQSYKNQLENKFNSYVGLNFNIPIFNGLSQTYSLKRTKLDFENASLELEREKRTIYKEIEGALLQLESAWTQFEASVQNLEYSKKSFEKMQQRLVLGLANITDVMISEDRYRKAQVDLLSAKYQWIVQRKLIDYYAGTGVI